MLDSKDLVERLRARLTSAEYREQLREVSVLEGEPFSSFAQARLEIQTAEGLEKVRLWIKNRLLEPKFDDPSALMPNLDLDEQEASVIANYLVDPPETEVATEGPITRFKDLLRSRPRYALLLGFVGGFLASGTVIISGLVIWRRRHRVQEV